MTEPSRQELIDRALEIGLSFNESQVSDEELSRAITTYERVYAEAVAEKTCDSEKAQCATERRKTLGLWSAHDEQNDRKIRDA
ncbi:hypothetical protein HBE99_04490 [Mycobacteroides chelonae]|uniref:hypothetical protein n=1 Tax=Mycobacteroides chelonae TaxID=1774 RepID=UPI0019103559|nr:hypothetical protein [Mycobacteroides chelonae]QQG96204.1 hypothetical protein HBE99_04490 [Mycobacteroides chelonae]